MAFMAEDTTVTIVPNFSLPAATGGFIRCIAVSEEERRNRIKEFCFRVFFFSFANSFSHHHPLSTSKQNNPRAPSAPSRPTSPSTFRSGWPSPSTR